MNELVKLCNGQDCTFNCLELHPQHGWIAHVTYKGVRGAGENFESASLAVVEAIRTAHHLYATYFDRPKLVGLDGIDL